MRYLKIIDTKKAPLAIGPYSQGIAVNNFYFYSGQIPINPKDGEVVQGDISVQTKQVLENISVLLLDQELDFHNVIKCTVFLSNMDDFSKMNEVYSKYFKDYYPARSAIEVSRLPKDVLVEIEVIAYKE